MTLPNTTLRWFMGLMTTALLLTRMSFAQYAPVPDPAQETMIQNRDSAGNGISLQTPKVYDDTSLQMMLNSARAQLSSVQGINQTSLLGGLGAISGGSSVQTGIGVQLNGGPALGQIAQTNTGPTSQTATVTGGTPSTTVTSTAPNQSTVTTTTPPAVPSVSLPSSTGFALPTTFGPNALNLLNEQMQLTYEITNLQLLLEGSLSDRYVLNQRLQKVKTTIGFPITIDAPMQYKQDVAVVEVEMVSPMVKVFDSEPPAITALLPQEKTYNVAAVTDKQVSIGAGVATAVLQGGFSFFHGRSTYYVVQDQDTIALQLHSSNPYATSFAWQFKPVLGQRYVQSGMRQTFVQLAVPINAFAGCSGRVRVKTYWREFDAKSGKSGNIVPGSLRVYPIVPITVYNLAPFIRSVNVEDLGGGLVEVEIAGQFINGTYVRVGSAFYLAGTPGFTLEPNLLRFTTSASALVKDQAMLVSRDGVEVPIVNSADPPAPPFLNAQCNVEEMPPTPNAPLIRSAEATAKCGAAPQVEASTSVLDPSTSLLSIQVNSLPIDTLADPKLDDYLINIAGHVFGLSDAQIRRYNMPDGCHTLFQAAVPTELLTSLKTFTVQPLLWSDRHTMHGYYWEAPFGSALDKVVLLEKDDKNATFLLQGNRLSAAQILFPPGTQLTPLPVGAPTIPDSQYSLARFTLAVKDWKSYKSILVQKRTGEQVEPISLPDPDPQGTAAPQTITVKFHPSLGTDEADFTGGDPESIKSVTFNGKALAVALSADKKTLIVRGLLAAGVTQTPTPKDLSFETKTGQKSTVTVDVVNYRVETDPASVAPAPAKPQ